MRKRAISSHARQQLILTALDRKEAGLKPNSKVATAVKKYVPTPPRTESSQPRSMLEPEPPQPLVQISSKPQKLMPVGHVTHYLDNINVAIILLDSAGIKNGDTLVIEGENFIFTQPVAEMQIDRKPVTRAKKGSHIGLKVEFPAKVSAKVYK